MKGKKATLKNPSSRESCRYLAGKPYPRNTREFDSLGRLFSFQSCASHMPFSQEPFSQTSRKLVAKCTSLHFMLDSSPN